MIFNSQKVEAIQVPTDGWMDKHVVYTYNGMLYSLKKEGNSDICYNMEGTWGHYGKQNKQSHKKSAMWFHLYDIPRAVKSTVTENRMVVARVGGRRNGSYCVVSAEFPFMRMKQSKWTVVMVALPCDYTKYSLNYILKMINVVNFTLCVLCHNI